MSSVTPKRNQKYKKIPLTQGKFAIVDVADYEWLTQWKWHFGGRGYALRSAADGKGKIWMHRVIMVTPDGMETDHINGITLDNRRRNLRICTQKENTRNKSRKASGKTSRYKGVAWQKVSKKWQVHIMADGTHHYLGLFGNQKTAAAAYDRAAIILHGKFAKLNNV